MPAKCRLLVCGDRNWTDQWRLARYMNAIFDDDPRPPECVIHGCAKGADTIGGLIAQAMGIKVEEYPADWDKYGKAAGVIRNQQMLDEGNPTVVLACHEDIKNSKGTADMIRRAEKAKIRVVKLT